MTMTPIMVIMAATTVVGAAIAEYPLHRRDFRNEPCRWGLRPRGLMFVPLLFIEADDLVVFTPSAVKGERHKAATNPTIARHPAAKQTGHLVSCHFIPVLLTKS